MKRIIVNQMVEFIVCLQPRLGKEGGEQVNCPAFCRRCVLKRKKFLYFDDRRLPTGLGDPILPLDAVCLGVLPGRWSQTH